jgi:hypothetical protein
MVGLATSAKAFFIYLALLILYTVGLKMMFGILAQTLPKKANVQGVGTFLVLLLSLFGGFMVYPDVRICNGFIVNRIPSFRSIEHQPY